MKKNLIVYILIFLSFFFFTHYAVAQDSFIEPIHENISVPIIDEDSVPTKSDSPIIITSNCQQTVWCSVFPINFSWNITDESYVEKIQEYRWSLDTQIPNTKTLKSIGLDTSIFFDNLENGIYYLYVDAVSTDKSTLNYQVYRVKIDKQVPNEFTPVLKDAIIESNQKTQLSFQATDIHSGIDYYEVSIDNGEWLKKESPLIIQGLDVGVYEIKIRAVDRARNNQIASAFIEVVKKLPTTIVSVNNDTPISSFWQKMIIPGVIVLVGLIILAIIIILKYRAEKSAFSEKG